LINQFQLTLCYFSSSTALPIEMQGNQSVADPLGFCFGAESRIQGIPRIKGSVY